MSDIFMYCLLVLMLLILFYAMANMLWLLDTQRGITRQGLSQQVIVQEVETVEDKIRQLCGEYGFDYIHGNCSFEEVQSLLNDLKGEIAEKRLRVRRKSLSALSQQQPQMVS